MLTARGVAPGDRVVAQVPTSAESVLLSLATQWVGGVYMPLNPALGPDETARLVDDADPTATVIGAGALTALAEAARGRDGGSVGSGPGRPARRDPADPAAIICTSGTTGRPKGAVVTHGNLASSAHSLAQLWGFSADDVTVHALPTFHAQACSWR